MEAYKGKAVLQTAGYGLAVAKPPCGCMVPGLEPLMAGGLENRLSIPRYRPTDTKKGLSRSSTLGLSYQDSNLDRQNQKLQCYHYTIRQSYSPKALRP